MRLGVIIDQDIRPYTIHYLVTLVVEYFGSHSSGSSPNNSIRLDSMVDDSWELLQMYLISFLILG